MTKTMKCSGRIRHLRTKVAGVGIEVKIWIGESLFEASRDYNRGRLRLEVCKSREEIVESESRNSEIEITNWNYCLGTRTETSGI